MTAIKTANAAPEQDRGRGNRRRPEPSRTTTGVVHHNDPIHSERNLEMERIETIDLKTETEA